MPTVKRRQVLAAGATMAGSALLAGPAGAKAGRAVKMSRLQQSFLI